MVSVDGRLPKEFGLSRGELKAAAEFFAGLSSARVRTPFREVAVVLQNDVESDAVHQAVMGVVGATDVITQRYDSMPSEPDGVYGEIYVNCERAISAAPRRRGWSAAKELLLYVAHGMDHLSGADDMTPVDYARMRRRELRWLDALARTGRSAS